MRGRDRRRTEDLCCASTVPARSTRVLTSPLRPDDYLALINPRWSTRELTGTVVRVRHETDDATTIVIKPDFPWPAHQPGQYLRIGIEINGIRHWRAYTITSDPEHPEGVVSVTVKYTEGGKMSPVFTRYVQPGRHGLPRRGRGRVHACPTRCPTKLLFLSRRQRHHADLEHAARARAPRRARRRGPHPQLPHRRRHDLRRHAAPDGTPPGRATACARSTPSQQPRFTPEQLDEHLPRLARARDLPVRPARDDRRGRGALSSRPAARTPAHRAVPAGHRQRRRRAARAARSTSASPTARPSATPGSPILVGGEEAGAKLPFGCRMGICHTCVGRLQDGAVRDLRTGERRARPAARWSAPASTRPKATSRSISDRKEQPLTTTARPRSRTTPSNPLHRLTARADSRRSARSSTSCTTRCSPTSATATRTTSAA